MLTTSTEKCPTPGSHVFQPTGIIFELIQDIIGMNLLTKFHEDRTVNMAYRTNLLIKFHEDWTINVASRVLTRKNAQPLFHDDRKKMKIAPPLWWPFINCLCYEKCPTPGSHVFQPTGIIFELVQDIIGINLLTELHEDGTINVASRVKNAPPLGGHVIQAKVTIFELIQDIIKTNLLTKFYQDWTIKVTSRVLTRFYLGMGIFYYSHIGKNAPLPGSHVFQPTVIIFKLIQDIIGMNLLTKHIKKNVPPLSKFHEDRKINVASRVLTRKNAPPPGGHVFQPTGIIFELFHEDQTITVASRVKNAPPLGSHVFQANVTIFELIQDIIKTNLLTKFHEDWTITVASRE
ncbi:hypothetical protein DPMN_007437 [Dreissena polymorpha]|uniref:Uncharacterized protein n=1 Tax=Dreissena polymorpha TaxID=45954 RepID=A0A9D4MWI7_DREPO|nr:hypothetical protein DPMN_007437 [Dreissena polymorpha]